MHKQGFKKYIFVNLLKYSNFYFNIINYTKSTNIHRKTHMHKQGFKKYIFVDLLK